MLKYLVFCTVLGFAWSQSTAPPAATAPAATTPAAGSSKFYYDKFYHQIVMVKGGSCYFHQLTRAERYDAKDAAGLQAIEAKILAAEKKLEEFGTETQSNLHFFSYSIEIRKACQHRDTYKITTSG